MPHLSSLVHRYWCGANFLKFDERAEAVAVKPIKVNILGSLIIYHVST